LGFLHYEIKEMVQKIRLMQKERQQMNGDLAAALGLGPISNSSSPKNESAAPVTGASTATQQQNGQRFVRPTQLVPVNTVVTNTGATQLTSADTSRLLTGAHAEQNHVLDLEAPANRRQTAI